MTENAAIQGSSARRRAAGTVEALLRSHTGLLDHAQVFRAFRLHKVFELGDRTRRHHRSRGLQARLDIRLSQYRVYFLVEPVDDGLRRPARRKEARPEREVVVLDARDLRNGWHVRCGRRPFCGREREDLQVARLDVRRGRRKPRKIKVDMISYEVVQCGTGSLVGNMREVPIELQFEQFAGKVTGSADPGRRESELG